ncbi:MAG: YbhB/YbcL family Raf kinase inhibitor-like protein [Nevskia sp.]|nr:YbhB/YbcL family Raf kinase inhibitor-like protein [Nevskia sp.]
MKLASRSFRNGGVIPGRCAFAVKAPRGHLRLSQNLNPELHWREVPAAARSLVLLVTDGDAPSPKPATVNTEGAVLAAALPRGEFVHWVMVDIPPHIDGIAEGSCGSGITAGGKRQPEGPQGSRQGINDYTGWFAGDADMAGPYFGYDGPCPPWNDSIPHHYRFELLAVDLERCPVEGEFTAAQVRQTLAGHVLASAVISGRYALNPLIRLR